MATPPSSVTLVSLLKSIFLKTEDAYLMLQDGSPWQPTVAFSCRRTWAIGERGRSSTCSPPAARGKLRKSVFRWHRLGGEACVEQTERYRQQHGSEGQRACLGKGPQPSLVSRCQSVSERTAETVDQELLPRPAGSSLSPAVGAAATPCAYGSDLSGESGAGVHVAHRNKCHLHPSLPMRRVTPHRGPGPHRRSLLLQVLLPFPEVSRT